MILEWLDLEGCCDWWPALSWAICTDRSQRSGIQSIELPRAGREESTQQTQRRADQPSDESNARRSDAAPEEVFVLNRRKSSLSSRQTSTVQDVDYVSEQNVWGAAPRLSLIMLRECSVGRSEGIFDRKAKDEGKYDVRDQARRYSQGEPEYPCSSNIGLVMLMGTLVDQGKGEALDVRQLSVSGRCSSSAYTHAPWVWNLLVFSKRSFSPS